MSPRTGRPTENPKIERVEIRLTKGENKRLEELAKKCGMSKSDVLKCGIQLVELQKNNSEFEELSNCLIIRELQKNTPLDDADRHQILNYLDFLRRKYI